jgi:hypothetical protein
MRPQRGPSRQRALPARCRQCSDLRRWWWACQDLNLGPHPHQVSRAQRCADRRFPRSLATVRGQGMRSNNLVRTGARTRCRGLRARYAHNPSPARRSDRDGGQAACPTRALRPARLAASTASPPASARTAARTPSEARSHPGCPLDLVGAGRAAGRVSRWGWRSALGPAADGGRRPRWSAPARLLAATRQLGCLLSRSQRRLVIPVPLPCKRPLGGRVRGRLTPWCDVAIAPGLPHLAFGGRPPGVLAFVVGLGLGDGGHAGRFMAASMGPSISARASLDMVASGRSTDAARTDWLLSGDGWPRASCHQPRATHDRRRRRGGRVWASASWWD